MSLFGKAKFGGSQRNWFKLKDGESTYRILPPMGDLQEDGIWHVFYSLHYGYKNTEGKLRVFQSCEERNRKTKMIEVRDPAKDYIDGLKAKLEKAKEDKNAEVVERLLKLVGGKKSRYNLDNNHYLNVVDLQGNIGILKIRHRAKLALDTQIKKLRDVGIEPLDPQSGRYFTFTRSGMGMDTVYQVSVYKRKLNVEGVGEVEQDVVHKIDEEFGKRCLTEKEDGTFTYKECGRLDQLFRKLTQQEVARLVNEGEKAVDEIFDSKETTAATYETDDGGTEDDEPVAATASAPASAPAPAATTTATETTPTPVKAEAAPAPVMSAPKAAEPPKTTAQAVATMTDAEFLKSIGA